MSPTAKAIAYGVVSLAAFILAFWWAYAVMDRPPTGCHAREDAPTLGDAIADWLSERASLAVLADSAAAWRFWLEVRLSIWPRRLFRPRFRRELRACVAAAVTDLREPAAAGVPGEGAAPAVGAVPLEVRVTLSDGFPAVAFRAGKQPWETAGQPRLPEVMS